MPHKVSYNTNKCINHFTSADSGCTGGNSCCTSNNRCGEDEGDCDFDADCKDGLACGTHNCKNKSGKEWDNTDDCCYAGK